MNITEEPISQTLTVANATAVSDIQLSNRHTEFLRRVRKHDASVKVFSSGEQLFFKGKSMSGLMPGDTLPQPDESAAAADEEVPNPPDTVPKTTTD